MPKYIESIQNIQETFTRPVITEILRDVMTWTGIPENTRITYPSMSEHVYQPGSTVDTQAEFNQFESQRTLRIDVTEEVLEEHALSISSLNKDHPMIFLDDESKIFAWPIFSPVEYVIEIVYRTHDFNSAQKWRDEIIARVAAYREVQLHQPKYFYVFPDVFMRVLEHAHTLRETGALPYGETLSQYIEKFMTPRASVITMGDGEQGRWGVRESQSRVIGYFDFTVFPDKPQKQTDTGNFTISFAYRVKIERPVACAIQYPVVINNIPIGEHFRKKMPMYTIPEVASYASKSGVCLGMFEASEQLKYREGRDIGIKIPDFVEFVPKQIPTATKNIMTILTTIDLDNTLDLLRFDQLGEEWALDPVILEFMRDEAPWLTKHGSSLLHVSVYRNDVMVHPNKVTIDNSLKLSFLDDPDPRDIHHVRLSYLYDWTLLTKDAQYRLSRYAKIVIMFANLMYPGTWEQLLEFGNNRQINRTPGQKRPPGVRNNDSYPFAGWTAGNSHKQRLPAPGGRAGYNSNFVDKPYDRSYGYDLSKEFGLKTIAQTPKRPIPWDGGPTPPGSSSTGIVSKLEFDNLIKFMGHNSSPDKSRLSWKNNIGYYRVMGLFVVSRPDALKD